MSWKNAYKQKLLSVEDAAKKIESGEKVWFGPCTSAPFALMEAIADRVDELENVDLITGCSLYPFKIFQSPKYIGRLNFHTTFYSAYERAFFKHGNINVNSLNLSQLAGALKDVYQVKTMLCDVSPPDEEGYMYYGSVGVFCNGEVAEYAEKIIVQVNKHQPRVPGVKNKIHVNDVTWICEHDAVMPLFPNPEVSEVDQKIAQHLLDEVPDGSTIQLGIGGLANAIGYGLDSKKNLSVYSEMFSDTMMHLYEKGVINGRILAAFGMGSQKLYDFMDNGPVQLAPVSFVNNPIEISKNENFISINSCLMADLTGQVCSESLGHNQYSSTGGQQDYAKGTSLSATAKSFLCMAATNKAKDGSIRSTITLNLPVGQVVTVPRSDVSCVVTEYGIANLKNKPLRMRVEEMISIAHPDFRESLRKEAVGAGLIRE